jgi:hypothetical protein
MLSVLPPFVPVSSTALRVLPVPLWDQVMPGLPLLYSGNDIKDCIDVYLAMSTDVVQLIHTENDYEFNGI